MEWRYGENRKYIELEKPPTRKLRISGHRFPTILGLNKYSTPFQAWCEIVGLVKKPFEENKYIFNLETDGSLTPVEVLTIACDILSEKADNIINFVNEEE